MVNGTPHHLSLEDRFWSKVAFIPFHDCWEWEAALGKPGYGNFYMGGGKANATFANAHKVAYELAFGQKVPKDKVVMHKCDNRSCVRPDHLKLGTFKENSQDMMAKGRGKMQYV